MFLLISFFFFVKIEVSIKLHHYIIIPQCVWEIWAIVVAERGREIWSFLSENTVSIPLLQARLRGLYSPWTLSVCQTSLGLAQEAQLIGLWGPPSMLILLEAAVCVCTCRGICGWAARELREGWSSKYTINSHLLFYFIYRISHWAPSFSCSEVRSLGRPEEQRAVNEAGPASLCLFHVDLTAPV